MPPTTPATGPDISSVTGRWIAASAVATPHDRVALPRQILVVGEVERLLVARDVEDVAVALRRDHPDSGAVVLDHDVGRDRRAVEDLVERGRALARLLGELTDAANRP